MRQSGMPELKVARLDDAPLVEAARTAAQAWVAGLQTKKTLGASPLPDAGCALSRAYPLRQRVTVTLAMVTVLPDSLRAC